MVEMVSTEEMKLIFDSTSPHQIIDVREIPEYQSVRIKGSKLLPLSCFTERIKEVDKATSAYFLCGVGKRALKAAEYLESLGYKNLYVIDGGIKAWIEAGFPVESG